MPLEASILRSVKPNLYVDVDNHEFDLQILDGINSALSVAIQLGIGPQDGFIVTGEDETWDDFVEQKTIQSLLRQYVPLKTREVFDAPPTSSVVNAIKERCEELEFRMREEMHYGGGAT